MSILLRMLIHEHSIFLRVLVYGCMMWQLSKVTRGAACHSGKGLGANDPLIQFPFEPSVIFFYIAARSIIASDLWGEWMISVSFYEGNV